MKKKLETFFFTFPAGLKLIIIFALSLLLFFINNASIIACFCMFIIIFYILAGFRLKKIASILLPAVILSLLLALFQYYASNIMLALQSSLRLFALLGLASFVTHTTASSALLAALERGLKLCIPFGLNPRKTALAVGLTIRFIPLIKQSWTEARAAHIARCGHEKLRFKSIGTLLSLTLTRLVTLHEEVTEAIEARGFDDKQ